MSTLFQKCLDCCKKLEVRNGLYLEVCEVSESDESISVKLTDDLTRNTLEIELYVAEDDSRSEKIAAAIHINHRTLGLKQLLNLHILLDTAAIVVADVLNDCNTKPRKGWNSRYKKTNNRSDSQASV